MLRKRIDGHVHLIPIHENGGIDPLTKYHYGPYGMLHTPLGSRRRLPPFMPEHVFAVETLVEVMQEYDIDKAVLMARLETGVAEAALNAMNSYPQKFVGAVCVEITDQGVGQLQKWKERGIHLVKFEMRGINERYGSLQVNCDVMRKLFAKAAELHMIVVIDPGPVIFPNYNPEQIKEVLNEFPSIRLVICHMGLPYYGLKKQPKNYEKWKKMIDLGKNANVWFDVTAIPDLFEEEGYPYPEAMEYFREILTVCGIDKLIWGTDIPGTFRNATYRQMISIFEECTFLTEEEKQKLFYDNANSLYFGNERQ